MDAHLLDWSHLVLRWFHIIAGIAWIGNSLFFMWLDKAFTPPVKPREGVTGELWMVHGGFFYKVEKQKPGPGGLPDGLHWFKWEATLTWLSGFFLLIVTYYLGGLMVDPSVSAISNGKAVALGLGVLAGGWLAYDLVWRALDKVPVAAGAISLAGLGGLAYGLSQVMSGRAAFMHVGALLGTIMVLNVWVHILPNQQQMITDLTAGRPADFARGAAAKKRSTHNTYVTFPVIYVMISNHFFLHYAHPEKWLVLGVLMLAGALVRHAMMTSRRQVVAALIPAAVVGLIVAFVVTRPRSMGSEARAQVADGTAAAPADAMGATAAAQELPAALGGVKGVIRFTGPAQPAARLTMTADCRNTRGGDAVDESLVTGAGGALANVVVHVSDGWQRWRVPAPAGEVTIDQRGCTYTPHVAAVRVGQPVTLVSSDPFVHNVHAYLGDETAFNEAMPAPGVKLAKTFAEPALFVQLKCDVHPWMNAKLAVLAHPWFAVSGPDGTFAIDGLPPGDYTLEAVHEQLGTQTQKITVAAGSAVAADFTFP